MGKNSMERIIYIDELLRDHSFPKKRDFAEHFEVSGKTIERDLEYMRDRLGAPVVYDRERCGYCYEQEGYYIPSCHMQQQEALALFISHYLGNAWKATPLADAAQRLWKRVSGSISEELLIDTSAFSQTVHLVDQSVEMDTRSWLSVFTAARNRRKIRITYRSQGKAAAERVIRPYRLIHHRNSWYVLAYDENRQMPLMFSISRIEGLTELDESFTIPEQFAISEYIDPRFGIHIGGTPFTVVIQLEKSLLAVVSEHMPATNRQIHQCSDSTCSISFETNQREELKHWLLQWGRNIEVIEPQEMRDELAAIGRYYVDTYTRDTPDTEVQ
jgi:predicted DNA-binding transcriptional regulator YafY